MIKEKVKKVINKKKFFERERFLKGAEELNFTKKEQVEFTYKQYVIEVMGSLKGNEKDSKLINSMFSIFK